MKENQLKIRYKNRNSIFLKLYILFISILLLSCTSTNQIFYISSKTRPCTGVGEMECMMIKKDTNQTEWENFYSQIEGFSYEKGYEYKLLIKEEKIENPPADGSNIRYILVKILSKNEVIQ